MREVTRIERIGELSTSSQCFPLSHRLDLSRRFSNTRRSTFRSALAHPRLGFGRCVGSAPGVPRNGRAERSEESCRSHTRNDQGWFYASNARIQRSALEGSLHFSLSPNGNHVPPFQDGKIAGRAVLIAGQPGTGKTAIAMGKV